LTVWLLAILAITLCLHLFLPQRSEVGTAVLQQWAEEKGRWGRLCHTIGLTDVLHSWPFWGPYALLIVNFALCMIRRIRSAVDALRFPEHPPRPAPSWLRREVEVEGSEVTLVAESLRKRGYRTLVSERTVYGLRGRFAVLGHWLSHLAVLVLLVGGAFATAAPDPFRGTVGVGEGEPFDVHHAPYLAANAPPRPDLPGLRLEMERIDVVTEGDDVRGFEATVSTSAGERATIGINRPYRERPFQVLVHGFGYMLGWVIVDPGGRMLNGAWVKLVPFPLEQADSFPLGPKWSRVHVRFHPDTEREGDGDHSGTRELRDPKFEVRVVWRGEEVFEGLIAPEQRVRLEADKEFFFLSDIRRYGMLDVIEERGHALVFACLAIAILGLTIRYVRMRKQILVQVGDGSLEIFGYGEILENLFAEEFARLAEELSGTNPDSGDQGGTD
jgi:hypothetical protein